MNIASIAPTTTVNEELVGQLERLLERARTGELVSLAICGELTGREVFSLVGGEIDVFRMLGAVEVTKARVLALAELD
jgi:hypothetical protein